MAQSEGWLEDEQALPKRERLKLFFLIPLGLVIAVITGLLIDQAYSQQREEIVRTVQATNGAMHEMFSNGIAQSTQTLGATMTAVKSNPAFRAALAKPDRTSLLRSTTPLMEDLRAHGITHWYFSDSDAINLLRVHAPHLSGDPIIRFTTREAARRGDRVTGIELGPLGTFTLRLVEPWYDATGKVIGYVELGSEIDVVLAHMQSVLDTPLYLFTRKKFLAQESTQLAQFAREHSADWNRFPGFVIAHDAALPEGLAQQLQRGFPEDGQVLPFDGEGHFRALMMHVPDAAGRQVAGILAVLDVSDVVDTGQQNLLRSGVVGVFAGSVLMGLFYWLLDGIEHRLEGHQTALRDLAIRDELTGLFNRRSFYGRINGEFRRATRYGHHLSLLLIDIDYFKAVNDTYGHSVGDEVLKEIAQRITSAIRAVDVAFRYGGEELVVILPETPMALALEIAERVRADIADRPFAFGDGESLSLSVSIGGASYPGHDSVDALVGAADRAMYAAKAAGRNRICCDEVRSGEPQTDPSSTHS